MQQSNRITKFIFYYFQILIHQAHSLTEQELWELVAQELLSSDFYSPQLKFVIFINCSEYNGAEIIKSQNFSYENIKKHLFAQPALGGGGLALFGTAYFYAWPSVFEDIAKQIQNTQKVDFATQADESNYRHTIGGVYASTLGALIHEIAHIFNCGHTEEGIMGRGFDYVNRLLNISCITEDLPGRIVNVKLNQGETANNYHNNRLTKFSKNTAGTFMQNYHEQKLNDGFYFTRNCALILAYNKWMHSQEIDGDDNIEKNICLQFNKPTKSWEILCKADNFMILIEIRLESNSLVKQFFEFKPEAKINYFKIPSNAQEFLNCQHYLQVFTINGNTKRLNITETKQTVI